MSERPMFYVLRDGAPVPVADALEWSRQREESSAGEYVVARDAWYRDDRTISVSTVFLGLDHSWGSGPPVLYETMVFGLPMGHPLDRACMRYATRDDARLGHTAMVALVQSVIDARQAASGTTE